jgi:hypothetical protein
VARATETKIMSNAINNGMCFRISSLR